MLNWKQDLGENGVLAALWLGGNVSKTVGNVRFPGKVLRNRIEDGSVLSCAHVEANLRGQRPPEGGNVALVGRPLEDRPAAKQWKT